jgi:hypothetical protein
VSRADELLAVIAAEVEAHRSEIDADDGLCTVGLIVKLDRQGHPLHIIWRPESQRQIGRTAASRVRA